MNANQFAPHPPPFPFLVVPGRGMLVFIHCDDCGDIHVTDEFLEHVLHWVLA